MGTIKPMLFRKLLLLFAPVALIAASSSAFAQFGVYGTVTGENLSSFRCITATAAPTTGCTVSGTNVSVKPYGANFGAYYDLRSLGPVRLGVDLRGGVLNSSKDTFENLTSADVIRQYSALGGVRGSVATPIKLIRPYAEVAVGYARFGSVDARSLYPLQNYTEFEGLIGIDVPILPYMDIRAIELGAGALFGSSTHGMESVGAGLVFHTTH